MPFDHNPFAYGAVTATAGTPVAVTDNFSSDTDVLAMPVAYLSIQALKDNAGNVYIGYSDMNTTTMAGVLYVIGPGESWGVGHPNVSTIRPRDIYIDVETTGEGVLVSGYQH